MRLSRVRALGSLRHPDLAFCRRFFYRVFEGFVERNGVGQRSRAAPGDHHVPQVMDGHPCSDDDDALVPKSGDGLAEPVVLVRVFGQVQAHLHDGDVERVLLGVEGL